MKAFKGFTKDLTATQGKGIYRFKEGETFREEKSKCISTGLHCAENPFDCFSYYGLGQGNRYFLVEAAGSLDEDGQDSKIACTEMTLLKELSMKEMAGYGMSYMIKYPKREWRQTGSLLEVKEDKAIGRGKISIAIARGKEPKVKGCTGATLGLLVETEPGAFRAAKLFEVTGEIKPDTWYTLENEKLKEVEDETQESIADSPQ